MLGGETTDPPAYSPAINSNDLEGQQHRRDAQSVVIIRIDADSGSEPFSGSDFASDGDNYNSWEV